MEKSQYMEVVDNKTVVNVWVVDKRYKKSIIGNLHVHFNSALSINKSSHVTQVFVG